MFTFEQWIAILSLLLAGVTFVMNRRKDSNNDAAYQARMDAKLDTLNSGMVDLRVEFRSTQKTLEDHGERLSKCEEKATYALRKTDELEALFHRAHPPER